MTINRRKFIKGLTRLAAAPLISLPWAQNIFASTAQKRVVFMYMPDGCIPSLFHPSGSETAFTLPEQTHELEAVKQHCTFVSGLTMFEGGSSHEGGARKVLTGNTDQSLDYFLGQQLGAASRFKSIHLGVASTFQGGSDKSVGYQAGGIPIAPNDNPLNAFNNIFSASLSTTEKNRQQSILDAAQGDLNRLKNQLGQAELAKLDEHTQALWEVEQRLKADVACDTSSFNTGGFRLPMPDNGYPQTMHLESNFETIGQLQMDVITRAFACNMTRVASISFSHAVSPVHVEDLSQGNHDSSHYGRLGSQAADTFSQYKRYFVRQLKYLMDALNREADSDGNTLLHNTLIFFFSELGDSNRHDHINMPFILAGNAGGALSTGRYLNFAGDAHSKLLVSIANLMGVNIDRYGYTGAGTGGLVGL